MAVEDVTRLRSALGEPIPPGGTESDTLFTDEYLQDLLLRHPDEFNAAVSQGWLEKSALLVTLVDTVEGSTQRKLSDAHDHALKQARYFADLPSGVGGGSGGTTIRKIRRRGT